MRRYAVKEIFYTMQGEGVHTGTPSVFLRFTGCNLWTGLENTRDRDAQRHGAVCPVFCDTDFVGGDRMTAEDLVVRVLEAGASPDVPIIATGGEPLLQLDAPLLDALSSRGLRVFVETNGTVAAKPGVMERVSWVCMSPKVARDKIKLQRCDEVKVVFPRYNPSDFEDFPAGAFFVQPEDGPEQESNIKNAVAYVLANPSWRISLQTHKILGVP